MKANRFPGLDKIDIRLVTELESDARQTYRDLANKLGMNRITVANKINNLVDNDVIGFVCLPDPLALGYEFAVYLAINAQPAQLNNVANRLATSPQIFSTWLCTGRFNIGAFALFRKRRELSDFISNELGTIDGLYVETLGLLEIVKAVARFLSDEKESQYLEGPRHNPDELDLKLIRELQSDARQKPNSLAKKLGTNETTVLRRIQRLVNERVILIRVGINPSVVGYEGSAYLGMKCDPAKIREVADAVASYKQVGYVAVCAGRYDILTFVWYKKMSDLRRFITVELGAIPGLREIEISLISKFIKYFDQISV
jgi:DNA-binding Lrp family transcriptional regulator